MYINPPTLLRFCQYKWIQIVQNHALTLSCQSGIALQSFLDFITFKVLKTEDHLFHMMFLSLRFTDIFIWFQIQVLVIWQKYHKSYVALRPRKWHTISICPRASDTHFDHLINTITANFPCNYTTPFLFIINKYLKGRYFNYINISFLTKLHSLILFIYIRWTHGFLFYLMSIIYYIIIIFFDTRIFPDLANGLPLR